MAQPGCDKLVMAIRKGDMTAFEFFFRAEYKNVVSFLMKYVHSRSIAEDVAQESFVALWQTRDRIVENGNIRAYVFTIAKNRALNEMALKVNNSRTDVEKKEVKLMMDALTSRYVSDSIEALEMESLISKVYRNLPDSILESFIMNREKGLTYREIAEKRGISQKSVEYHIKVALGVFRDKLKDYIPALTFLLHVFQGLCLFVLYI